MSYEPARRRAVYGLAGAHDRQIPADRHVGLYTEFLRRHELEAKQAAQGTRRDQENLAACLLNRAGDTRNVRLAIEHCASRGQAAGPDGLHPADLDQHARWQLAKQLSPLIRAGEYRPSKPRTTYVDKGGNRGQRPIHIQDFDDRSVERAVLQVIRPLLEPQFLDCSLGFRFPGLSREEPLAQAERMAMKNDRWTWISQDLKDAFENVPHQRLIQVLRKMIPANPICHFIERITAKDGNRGIRQGGPLSPVMLNVYLHWMLDRWWQRHFPEIPFLRVADDLLILARPEEANHLHDELEKRTREIGMPIKHPKGTAIKDLAAGSSTTEWLGYGISRTESGLHVHFREKSWFNLEKHLHLAWEDPHPSISARESILGWVGQQGAAYRQQDVCDVYAGITRRASNEGFEEIPCREEMASRWYQAFLRDWANRREVSLIPESPSSSSSTLADGFADRRCDFPASSSRSGVGRLRDASPQQVPIRREVFLYCDGSCLSPHGVGGWAYLMIEPETGWRHTDADAVVQTTNNRMELTAVIQGLTSLSETAHIHLVVDSEYVHKGITEWLPIWERNGWRAGRKRTRPLKNKGLWQRLASELNRHYVDSQWVRGHSGHAENEYVDRLACEAARSLRAQMERRELAQVK